MNRYDFQRLTAVRLRDAKVLLDSGNYEGAYYLVGYAVECALKACIAKQTRRYDFPEVAVVRQSHTHDFEQLIRVARLETDRTVAIRSDPNLEANWLVVQKWRESSRYESINRQQAEELFAAVSQRRHGVLRWVKKYW